MISCQDTQSSNGQQGQQSTGCDSTTQSCASVSNDQNSMGNAYDCNTHPCLLPDNTAEREKNTKVLESFRDNPLFSITYLIAKGSGASNPEQVAELSNPMWGMLGAAGKGLQQESRMNERVQQNTPPPEPPSATTTK
jgi:hypothetical protein